MLLTLKQPKRPFYIIVIGSGENINFIEEKLKRNQKLQDQLQKTQTHLQHDTALLISENLNTNKKVKAKDLINISSQSEGYKFEYKDNLPIYEFITSKKILN